MPTRIYRRRTGNIVAMLFGGVALVGVMGASVSNLIVGPATTVTKVTQKNMTENDLLMNAKVVIMHASTLPLGGDEDDDGYIEPAAFIPTSDASCNITLPGQGGCLPHDIGAVLTDPWGTLYAYCVWDHGEINSSTNRIDGEDKTSGAVLAIISAGPNKQFETPCLAYDGDPDTNDIVINPKGVGDDLVQIYTYAGAVAGSGGLWTLKRSEPDTAIIDKKLEVGDVAAGTGFAFDTTTGTGEFPYIKTDYIASKTANRPVTMASNIALDGNWLSGDGGGEGISIDNAGRVGIGVKPVPDSPLLEVRRDGADPVYTVTRNAGGGNAGFWTHVEQAGAKAVNYLRTVDSDNGNAHYWYVISDGADGNKFKIGQNAGFGAANLTIQKNGNVGIGTVVPATSLSFGDTHSNAMDCSDEPHGYLRTDSKCRNDVISVYEVGEHKFGFGIHEGTLEIYGSERDTEIGVRSSDGSGTFTPYLHVNRSGNVGIGTSAPATRLHVVGDFIQLSGTDDADLILDIPSTSAASPEIQFRVDNANVAHIRADHRNRYLYISERMTGGAFTNIFLTGGKVGIGASEPQRPVHVLANNPSLLLVERPNHYNAGIQYKNTIASMFAGLAPESVSGWGVSNDRNIGAESLFMVRSNGNVGIGTTAPTEKLQVAGKIDVTNNRILRVADPIADADAANKAYVDSLGNRTCANAQILKYQSGSWACAADNSGGGADNLGGGGTTTGALYSKNASGYGYIGQDGNNYFRFDAGAGANRILTRVGGEWVLLNDTSTFRPYANNTLDLGTSGARWKSGWFTGDVSSGSNTVSGPIYNDHSSTAYDVWIQGGAASATGDARNLAILGVISGDYLSINHSSEYTGGTRIGGPVNIIGDTAISGAITSSAGTIRDSGGGWVRTYGNTGWYSQTHGGGWFMSDTTWIRAYSNKSVVTGGNMQAAAFLYGSDERLKADIRPLNLSLDDLDRIGTYRYHYKTDVDKTPRLGVIAQEVQSVFPEAVQTGEDGMMSVDYPALVPVLLDAVKQLKTENDAMRRQMKVDNDNLRMEIRALTKEAR